MTPEPIREATMCRTKMGPEPMTPAEVWYRFWKRVDKTAICWNWTGYVTTEGYGQFHLPGVGHAYAHRFSYEAIVGPIENGLTLDHLCRNTICVNPAHLEPVTVAVNTLRGFSNSALNARKKFCKRGHPFKGRNLMIVSTKSGIGRVCRECCNEHARRYREARKNAIRQSI